ncbi:glycogen branching protein [Stutzerimonas decontaminans]|uniref:Glycogen branching protein n=1 Tax=Stutzerimonas decontaminans TaxID=3022791 RepID=A0ABX4VXW6_9GAMM|nr:glycogen branching protein [Stutzerimonas decontaminans]MCQ4245557.1 glycogen branching protein [Stutzerimonas decontaminans]PNF85053.1 glycogen branching protein [Stutzerimonas decontaminans]
MPKINVAKPFNYQKGGKVQFFKKGEQDVDADVAAHAAQRGYLVGAKAKAGAAEPEAKPAAEPK